MSATHTGKLLVLHDEYMLSDHGIQQAPDTETFISNIAKLFYRNNGGKFLDYTTYYITNPTVQGNGLEKILSTPPYSYIRDCAPLLTLDFLSKFEAIFVGGLDVDNQILIDYVKAGGNVCLIAGTGHGGSASSEATGWNQLLGAFGLRLESSYNDITGVRSVTSPSHPLFAGVKNLFQYWGQTVQLLPDSKASIIMTADSQGLIGYAEVPVASTQVAPIPTPNLPANPVAGDPSNGFYTTNGNGDIFLLKQHPGLPKTWSLIIPGNFGGNTYTDLLFYNQSTGEAQFYTTDGKGNMSLLSSHSGWRKTWSLIIPGNFGGNAYTDLLFYDPTTGDAEIYTTDGNGNISLLKKHTGWLKTWTQIIPGNFGGSEYTDLFFYDPTLGRAAVFTTDGSGNTSLLKIHDGWRKTWSLIIPGKFSGSSFTDLLIYDATAAEAEFFTTDGNGNIFSLKKHTGWRRTWSQMIPGDFGGNGFTDLIFYDQTSAEWRAEFFTTDGNGNIYSLKRHTSWRKTWQSITPGKFTDSSYTSLFFYDTTAD